MDSWKHESEVKRMEKHEKDLDLEARLLCPDGINSMRYVPMLDGKEPHFLIKIKPYTVMQKERREETTVQWVWDHVNREECAAAWLLGSKSDKFFRVTEVLDDAKTKSKNHPTHGQICAIKFVTKPLAPGYCFIGKTLLKGQTVPLEREWVQKQFSETYLDAIIKNVKHAKGHYVPVPPGCSRRGNLAPQETCEPPPSYETTSQDYPVAPVAKYQQGKTETCLFSSTACGLHYYGYINESEELQETGLQYEKKGWLVRPFLDEIHRLIPRCIVRRIDNLNILEDKSPLPTVAILVGSDESNNHAICVVGEFIFDTNCHHALPLSLSLFYIYKSTRLRRFWYAVF